MRRNDEDYLRPSAPESSDLELVAPEETRPRKYTYAREFLMAVWRSNKMWIDGDAEAIFGIHAGRPPRDEKEIARMVEIAWDKCDLSRIATGQGVVVNFADATKWFSDAMKKEFKK